MTYPAPLTDLTDLTDPTALTAAMTAGSGTFRSPCTSRGTSQ